MVLLHENGCALPTGTANWLTPRSAGALPVRALFDLTQAGRWLRLAAYFDPFTYCVDLMRWVLLGWGVLPSGLDLAAVLLGCAATAAWGIISFGGLQQTR